MPSKKGAELEILPAVFFLLSKCVLGFNQIKLFSDIKPTNALLT